MKITEKQFKSILSYAGKCKILDSGYLNIGVDAFYNFVISSDIFGNKSLVFKFQDKYWCINETNILTVEFPNEFIYLIRKSLGEYGITIMVIRH